MRSVRGYRDLSQARDGASAIELALLAPILVLLLFGVVDWGRGFWAQMQVTNSAQAGVQYVQAHGWSQANAEDAARNATNLSVSPNATQACGCPDASTGITAATCGSACSGGGTAAQYTKVTVSASFHTIFPWPGIPDPMTLQSTAWTQ